MSLATPTNVSRTSFLQPFTSVSVIFHIEVKIHALDNREKKDAIKEHCIGLGFPQLTPLRAGDSIGDEGIEIPSRQSTAAIGTYFLSEAAAFGLPGP